MFGFSAPSEHVSELVSAYLDNELSASDRARVEKHLADCAECQRQVETLRWTIALTRDLPRVAVPRAFTLRQPAPRPATRWVYGTLRAATALAALLFVLVTSGELLFGLTARDLPAAAPAPRVQQEEGKALATPAPALAFVPPTLTLTPVLRAAPTGITTPALAPAYAAGVTPSEAAKEAASPPAAAPPAMLTPAPTIQALPQDTAPTPSPTATPSPTPAQVAVVAPTPAPAPTLETRAVAPVEASPLRWLQVGLFLAAIALGTVTLIVRQRTRSQH